MKSLLPFSILVLGVIFGADARATVLPIHGGNYTSPDNVVDVAWFFDEDFQEIRFEVRATTDGWVGISVSETGVMADSDFAIHYMNDNEFVSSDRWHIATGVPPLDTDWSGTHDLYNAAGFYDGTYFRFDYTRLCDTGDEFDTVVSDRDIYILVAYGAVNQGNLSYHSGNRFRAAMNFFPSNVTVS
eukprot:NODE_2029_length_667_cov_99.120370_g1979_i0.p1 GENE.NODE_2029_length_667_cov_99.120370_g1979_i0~~NODE_2029_length_667_cov_99.120370_g1979_i0.p1  ORF type:complete len:208 (+),score=65.58 NODE_2029_length_667_cov_99.120370_g1979_i0:68-625(+)